MIWLDDRQLVDAVRRSLLEHVAPATVDAFVRTQVIAAAHVLAEVSERLTSGDPVSADSAAVERVLHSWGVAVPAADERSERARNSTLRESAAAELQNADRATRTHRLAEYTRVEAQLADGDREWICDAALTTLE